MKLASCLKSISAFCLTLTGLLLGACVTEPSTSTQKAKLDSSEVTIVTNATIYTVDEKQETVPAFAHHKGLVVARGDLATLNQYYPQAKQLDLNGATVVPGFIDAHGHLLGLGQSLIYVDLVGTTSKDDIIDRLKAVSRKLHKDQWLLGRGWDQNDWDKKELPSAADLDKAFPDRPVWLERVDGHAGWANSVAMSFAKQSLSGDWQPDGGEIVRNASKQASGVFIDNASKIIQDRVPAPSDAELIDALQRAIAKTASVGITSMHDAGTSFQIWKLLESLNRKEKINLRVYAMADGGGRMLDYLCNKGAYIDPDMRLTARSVKLYSDGALGSRGAALFEDYSDAPNNKGLLIESQETLSKLASRAANCGLQVNIHAIGDRGNRVTLDVLETASDLDNPGRHRIEHSQVIAIDDFKRFKELGLIASVQPTHATSDMYWAEDRLGKSRIKGAYAWQTFLELGVPLALGSDFPVERADPLLGFYAAITRQDSKAWPADGWYADQKLSRKQALHGFTLGAAYAAFQEHQLGSLSVGKRADFTVLSKDIMRIEAAEILNTQVLATYIDGQAIFKQTE